MEVEMDLNEYEGILSELDRQITAAKASHERRTKREALESRLKEIEQRIPPIERRVSEIRQLGEEPSERVLRFLESLQESAGATRKESEALAPLPADLLPPPPAVQVPSIAGGPRVIVSPPSPAKPLAAPDRRGFLELLAQIEGTDLRILPAEETRLIVLAWALRWRRMVETAGQERAEHDRDVKRCFALIAQERDRHKLEMIPALARNGTGDWAREQAGVEAALRDLRGQREARQARENQLFPELRELMRVFTSHADLRKHEDSPEARRFRHLVREIGRSENLRDQLSEMCRPYRPTLEPEFAFLWKMEDDEEEDPIETSRRLTNQEIMRRLLRRMVRKGIIGGKTCPTDMLFRGFPPHDAGRAKEALELLTRVGAVMLSKAGDVAALSTECLKQVKACVEGRPFGIEAVDAWTSEEPRVART
jgi:hypothetical protein